MHFVAYHVFFFLPLQKESMTDQQLHLAALQGDLNKLRLILDSGKVHVDCKDKVRSRGEPLINKKTV